MMNRRPGDDRPYPGRGLHGRVVHDLGARIVSGAVPPGALLPNEDELGAELGVSRSVLREAIKVLGGKGLLDIRPKIGTKVRPRRNWHLLDPDVVRWQFEQLEQYDDLRELAEVRSTIEPTAAYLAAQRRTEDDMAEIEAHCKRMESASAEPIAFEAAELDFHAAVVDASHNMMLSHMGTVIRVAVGSAAMRASPNAATNGHRGTDDHRVVLDAIRDGDAPAAKEGVRTVLDRWWTELSAGPTASR